LNAGKSLLILLITSVSFCLKAQEQSTTPTPEEWIEIGDAYIDSGQYQEAKTAFGHARPYFEQQKDYYHLAYAYLWLSEANYALDSLSLALQQIEISRQLVEQQLDPDSIPFYSLILQNLGVFNSALGNMDAQMQWYQKARQAAVSYHGIYSKEAAEAIQSLGVAYGYRGDWSKCISLTERAFQIADSIGYRAGKASALLNLAHSFAEKEDYQKAVRVQERALMLTDDKEDIAKGLNNLGTHYTDLANPQKALEHLYEALDIRRQLYHPNDDRLLSTRLNIIYAYVKLGDLDKALPVLEEIFQRHPSTSTQQYYYQVAYNYKAKLLLIAGQHQEALSIIRQSLQIPNNDWNIKSSSHLIESEILFTMGRYDAALNSVNQGLNYQVPGFTADSPLENPPWKKMESIDQGRSLLKMKGDILHQMGLKKQDTKLLKAALSTLQQGDALVMWTRQAFHNQKSKEILSANASLLYSSLMETLYELYLRTNEQEYFDLALSYMEKNKALPVLENLNKLYANSYSGVPDEVVRKERALQEDIEKYTVSIKQSGWRASQEQLEGWKNTLYARQKSLDSLIKVMERQYPRYFQMKHAFSDATSAMIGNQLLLPGEAFLEFFIQEEQVYILAIEKGKRSFLSYECNNLIDLCLRLRRAVNEQSEDFFPLSHELYQCLLEPILEQVEAKRLVIVPDGILTYIPFEMLLTAPVARPADQLHKDMPYFIKSYSLRYLISANTALSASRNNTSREGSLLAMAPVFGGNKVGIAARDTMSSLPGAQVELDSLQFLFPGLYFRGMEATEANFKQQCGQQQVYHIATHTNINDDLASASYLLLEPGKGQDGKLHSWELYNLEMRASLAVLSGCNTGIGKLKKGVGSTSLAHAFAYAGCPNLVMTLWPARDNTTPTLMSVFYRNMEAGMAKHEALRQAKLYCLQYDDLFAHPYYWSGFIYVGDQYPLDLSKKKRPFPWIPLISGSFFLILILTTATLTKRAP